MVIALPPELEILVQNQVGNGNYENAIDRHIVFYIPIGEDIEILRIVNGYRDLSALFSGTLSHTMRLPSLSTIAITSIVFTVTIQSIES